jgi:hypothetical protein
MTERQKDLWSGWLMATLFMAIPLLGWLVLRIMLRYT